MSSNRVPVPVMVVVLPIWIEAGVKSWIFVLKVSSEQSAQVRGMEPPALADTMLAANMADCMMTKLTKHRPFEME